MLLRVLTILILGLGQLQAQRLITEADPWRYYKGASLPPLQSGLNWTQPAYSDSNWGPASPSGFGYGDGDDNTIFNDMQNNYLSVYLRKTFTVTDPAGISYLTLAVNYDDGFIAYLNGVEVARRNMPASGVINTTPALTNHEAASGNADGDPQEEEFITIDKSLLVAGSNLLAIEGHNVSLGSSDFSLMPELYEGVNLIRGPYLQIPVVGAMTIIWRTDALTDAAIDWGLDASYADGTISDSTLATEHEITIPNLSPNTIYHYRVRSGGVTVSTGNSFRAPPLGAQPFRFSVVGDFGYGANSTINVANRVANSNCDLLLTVGDNIYDPPGGGGTGQPGVYNSYWFGPYAATLRRAPIFPALGNHELETANGSWYVKYFRLPQNGPATELERNYSFDYGNAHFVALDANPFVNTIDGTGQRQAAIKNWLASDLAATTQRWKFVYFHQPAYTSSGSGLHSPETVLQTDIIPICIENGVQIIFQGHNHFYERINPINGVNYITTGGGGRSLTPPTVFPTYSAVTNSSVYSFTQVDIDGGKLTLRQIDATRNQIDSFSLDLDHPFRIDGLLDSASFLRAANPNGLKLYAAIRGNVLYLATQDAGEGSDHFIYLNNQSASLRAANWAKTGQVMNWSAFLADENETGFKGWFNSSDQLLNDNARYAAATSGLNNNDPTGNGVLEGTIDLRAHFGSFPAQIYLAAAPFSSPDGGALISGAQVPLGNGDGNIQSNEFVTLNTRDLALDLPTSAAGPDQSVEAGMNVLLNGSATRNGLPLSFAWTQLSGPAVTIINLNQLSASFAATSNVSQPTDLLFRLRVNDTRFDVDDEIVVQLYPMLDSDGDGLSDQEELTGHDNGLTNANPAGVVTDPNRAETDGDGATDGEEALAGTNPNSTASVFRILEVKRASGSDRIVVASITGRSYQLQIKAQFSETWSDLGDPIASTGDTTLITVRSSGSQAFYRIRLAP